MRKLEKAGVPLPPTRPSPRIRFLLWIAGRFGTQAVLPMVLMGVAFVVVWVCMIVHLIQYKSLVGYSIG